MNSWKWCRRTNWRGYSRPRGEAVSRAFLEPRPARNSRHRRVGSSSGSGVSWAGRMSSGTWRRLTRMRVQVEERPRMESTRTSSTARCAAAAGYLAFQRSRPARAASRSGELATVMQRHFGARLGGWSGRARVRLAAPLLRAAKVRRPGGVGESRGLIFGGEFEELFQRTGVAVHGGMRVADVCEALGHGEDGEVGRIAVGDLAPVRAAWRRERRAGGGRSRPSRWCGPWRSGCSRGRLRGAPLSTIWNWRCRGARRSTARESATAARRTSAKVQRGCMRTLMCMPREPLVLGQPWRPISESRALTSSATVRTCSQGTPGPGSRSTRSSSG